MNVLVIGAGGKTGKLVIEQALAVGHRVTALVHEAKEDEIYPATVTVVHGDVRNPTRLDQVMTGQDAVIDTLGGKTPWVETDLESSAANGIIASMKDNAVRRLIVVSAMGEGESKEHAGFLYRNLLMPTFLRGTVKDKAAMETAVVHSGLTFIIVRPPLLTDADATGAVHVVQTGEMAHTITRADLARFLVEQLTSDIHVGCEVTIANT